MKTSNFLVLFQPYHDLVISCYCILEPDRQRRSWRFYYRASAHTAAPYIFVLNTRRLYGLPRSRMPPWIFFEMIHQMEHSGDSFRQFEVTRDWCRCPHKSWLGLWYDMTWVGFCLGTIWLESIWIWYDLTIHLWFEPRDCHAALGPSSMHS